MPVEQRLLCPRLTQLGDGDMVEPRPGKGIQQGQTARALLLVDVLDFYRNPEAPARVRSAVGAQRWLVKR